MTGTEAAPAWLQMAQWAWVPGQFSPQRRRAIKRYSDLVREGVGLPSVWAQLRGQVFPGSDAFFKSIIPVRSAVLT